MYPLAMPSQEDPPQSPGVDPALPAWPHNAMGGLHGNVANGATAAAAGSCEAMNVGAAGEDGYVARLSSSGVTFAPCP